MLSIISFYTYEWLLLVLPFIALVCYHKHTLSKYGNGPFHHAFGINGNCRSQIIYVSIFDSHCRLVLIHWWIVSSLVSLPTPRKYAPIIFLTLDASNIEHWSIHDVSHIGNYLFDEIKHSQRRLWANLKCSCHGVQYKQSFACLLRRILAYCTVRFTLLCWGKVAIDDSSSSSHSEMKK
jgi:hypothetical protein